MKNNNIVEQLKASNRRLMRENDELIAANAKLRIQLERMKKSCISALQKDDAQ